MKKNCVLFLALLLLGEASAFAWGNRGHEVIAQLAYDQLTPQTRANIDVILADKGVNAAHVTNIISAATWPDDIKISTTHRGAFADEEEGKIFNREFPNNHDWHFVNCPLGVTYSLTNDFSRETDIVHVIGRCVDVLEGNSTSMPWNHMSQKEALAWLVHLVGDLHQPLHVGCGYYQAHGYRAELITDPGSKGHYVGDRGGNLLHYNDSSENLHSFWDIKMVDVVASRGDLVAELGPKVTHARKNLSYYREWPVLWANKSLHAARSVYADLKDFKFDPDTAMTVSCKMDSHYADAHRHLAEEQMVRAARDLADLLNAIHWETQQPIPTAPTKWVPQPHPANTAKKGAGVLSESWSDYRK